MMSDKIKSSPRQLNKLPQVATNSCNSMPKRSKDSANSERLAPSKSSEVKDVSDIKDISNLQEKVANARAEMTFLLSRAIRTGNFDTPNFQKARTAIIELNREAMVVENQAFDLFMSSKNDLSLSALDLDENDDDSSDEESIKKSVDPSTIKCKGDTSTSTPRSTKRIESTKDSKSKETRPLIKFGSV